MFIRNLYKGLAQKGYLHITLLALIACAPVYTGFFALKHDFMAFDWPIHFFTGRAIQQGIFPMWLDTWNFGFPLQGIFSWNVFSTIFQAIAGLSGGSLWWLQAEWCFFIWLGGVSFLKLLRFFSLPHTFNNVLFSAFYMLGGAVIGTSQWMFYLSALGLFPLCVYFLLKLFQQPSLRYALLFPVSFYIAITHVHVFFTVVFCYLLLGISFFQVYRYRKLLFKKNAYSDHSISLKSDYLVFFAPGPIVLLAFALALLLLLSAPVFYYSLELLPYLGRGSLSAMNPFFAQSNYMHPFGLFSLFVPLSQLKSSYPNTEPLFQHFYLGLSFPFLFVLALFVGDVSSRKLQFTLGLVGFMLLMFSFGYLTPFYKVYKWLPGMAYFRHTGLLRLFVIGFLLTASALAFRQRDIIAWLHQYSKLWAIVVLVPVVFALGWGILHTGLKGFSSSGLGSFRQHHFIVLSAFVQLCLFTVIFAGKFSKGIIRVILLFDICLQALLLMPAHTLSSYRVAEVEQLLSVEMHSFQKNQTPREVEEVIVDDKGNKWLHHAVFSGSVGYQTDVGNPLTLRPIDQFFRDSVQLAQCLFNSFVLPDAAGLVVAREPGKVKIEVQKPTESLSILQANFPGWKAMHNGKKTLVPAHLSPWVTYAGTLPPKTQVTFYYAKPGLVLTACLGHFIVLLAAIYAFYTKLITPKHPSS